MNIFGPNIYARHHFWLLLREKSIQSLVKENKA